MSGRYLVTGVQLGIIKGLTIVLSNKDESLRKDLAKTEMLETIDEILEKQFIENSHLTVEEDIEKIKKKEIKVD